MKISQIKIPVLAATFLVFTFCAQEKKSITLFHVKTPYCALSRSFLRELATIFKTDIFVETGTCAGNTTEQASTCFREIHTIELARGLYNKASSRFKNRKHIHVYLGDSAKHLQKILPKLKGKILFWLDSHYCGGSTARGEKNTPIVEELQAIKRSGITNGIILVDDVRCFEKNNRNAKDDRFFGYPTISELEQLILQINPTYQFKIFGDIAIAYPASERVVFSPVVQACTISRMAFEKNIGIKALIGAEKIIASAQGEERSAIEKLYETSRDTIADFGIGKYHHLWFALILAKQKDPETALELFGKAIAAGIPFWRTQIALTRI